MQLAPPLAPPPPAALPSSGTPPHPPGERWASTPAPLYRKVLSLFIAVGPPVAAVIVTVRAIGEPMPWLNLILLTAFYFVIAHGVTIGFHRLFTHRSFEARRPLKIVLAVLGSMSFQGSIIGWVADHRRHHRYADRPGDPHSPVVKADEPLSGWRGMLHAHVTWVFDNPHTPRDEFAPDLLADPDLVLIDRLFVPCCIATLALPFGLGYALTGTLGGAFAALLWAGVLRVGLGHHLTWAINSVCHRFGRAPFRTRDRSTNFAPLALLTGGESWHNAHHAFPTSARHGVDRGQLDTSARLIRWFEQLGWATQVRWPTRLQLDARRTAL
jgi:stearoyl-CoA desaturase (delta-9 desaturase)